MQGPRSDSDAAFTLYEGENEFFKTPSVGFHNFLRKVNENNTYDNYDADLTLIFTKNLFFTGADALSYTYQVYEKKTAVLIAEEAMFFTEATAQAVGNILGKSSLTFYFGIRKRSRIHNFSPLF